VARVYSAAVLLARRAIWLLLALACASPGPGAAGGNAAAGAEPWSALYQLELPAGWKRVPDPKNQADLQAEHENGLAWLIVRSTTGPSLRLEDLVAVRREAVFEADPVLDYRETRSYHRKESGVAASLARYQLRTTTILVMTAIDGTVAVECIGAAVPGTTQERELLALFESLRFVDEAPK
jgi:hypothetical protein